MLEQLIRILNNQHAHFTILKFHTGWKVVYGTPHLEDSDNPNSDYQRLFRDIETTDSLEKAILDCLERGDGKQNIF